VCNNYVMHSHVGCLVDITVHNYYVANQRKFNKFKNKLLIGYLVHLTRCCIVIPTTMMPGVNQILIIAYPKDCTRMGTIYIHTNHITQDDHIYHLIA